MARRPPYVAFLLAMLALAPHAAAAQRPALSGEKARVAAAVRADLARLAQLQKAQHERTKLYAADVRDLRFTATSGATVNIAYASMNSWAANASHPTLAPVACYVIVSVNDAADAPSAQPFCTEAKPGTAAGNVAAATTPAPERPSPQKAAPPAAQKAQQKAPQKAPQQAPQKATPSANAAANAARPVRQSAPPREVAAVTGRTGEVPGEARLMTREVIANANAAERTQPVTPSQFADALAEFSRNALAVLDAPPPVITRDPYESTQEFETRRDAAIAAHERREAEFFRENTRTYVVTMPVRDVRYDADREVVEFAVDPIALPVRGGSSELSLACYTRPVFWCTAAEGMTYDAGDLWRVPRAVARQHDVLRTPMVLVARYTVGRIEGERGLAISLVDMDLQARGQSVQRWPASR